MSGAVWLWDSSDWRRPDVLLLLLVLTGVLCELISVRVGHVHFSASNVATSLAVILLGGVPGMIVGLCGVGFDVIRRRPGRAHTLGNIAVHAAVPVLAGVVWEVVAPVPGTSAFLLGAVLLTFTVDVAADARRLQSPQRLAQLCAERRAGLDERAMQRRGREGHLGIALLRRRVVQAGGRLQIHTPDGGGTTVSIALPAGD